MPATRFSEPRKHERHSRPRLAHGTLNLASARNLCIISVTLVTGIGGLAVQIGSFSLQGISLCGVLAVLLNLLLPNEPAETPGAR